MKRLSHCIFREFSKKFLLLFLVINAFLLLVDAYSYLEKFLTHHIPFREFFYFYMAHNVVYLPLTITLTFILTIILLFYVMHNNREIILLFTSGIHFFQITRILLVLGITASSILWLANFHGIPKSQEYITTYLEDLETRNVDHPDLVVKHLTLSTPHHLWYINRYNPHLARAFDIAVHDYDATGMEWRRISAQSGYFNEHLKAWTFEHGREILFDLKTQTADKVHIFEQRTFRELKDEPQLMLWLKMPLENLSLLQLQKIIKNETLESSNYRMQFWRILLGSFFPFLSCWIILPFLFSGISPHENPLYRITKLGIIFLPYGIISYILYALSKSGTLYWPFVLLILISFVIILPFTWLRKLL